MTALWVASTVGAVLFFASGILSAETFQRLLGIESKATPDVQRLREAEQQSAELLRNAELRAAEEERLRSATMARQERLLNDIAEAQSIAQNHRREVEMLRQQLEIEIQTKASIDRELSQARVRAEDSTRRLSESQKSSTLVPTLRKRLEEIEQAQATRARAAEQAEEKNRALERDLTRARGEITRLATQLSARVDTQTLSLENDIKRLNEEQQERALRIKMLTDRITELEAYAEENASLKAERDALQREVDRLRRAAREAVAPPPSAPPRVQVDPVGMATITRPNQSGTTRRVADSENTLEASLKQHLSGLLAREPGLIAVLSDDNGFPVAGVGTDQQQEGVSVLTSLAQELAFRVKEFVDLERIERIELADAAGRALRVRLFDWETQPLALACLGKRSLVANPDEELVVTAFPKLLRKAWSA
jgi:DNA repair exonuclease SbcCD ATPase subunit